MCVCVCVGGCVSVCMCGCAEHITKCIIYKKHSISCQWETQKRKLAQTGWLVLRVTAGLKKGKISYIEIIAVCSEIHTKHINTLCGQIFIRFCNATCRCSVHHPTLFYCYSALRSTRWPRTTQLHNS